MHYIKVTWTHSSAKGPVLLYSELDEERWETRKIEVFVDGRMGHAASDRAFGGTELGSAPVSSLAEINEDSQFSAAEIASAEFQQVWEEATSGR